MNQLILGDNLEIQSSHLKKFEPGQHSIAVKAVDNEGLEAVEVVRVKVNGIVEREGEK